MKPTLPSLIPPNTLSRRNWLRNAAMAATGVAVMPSLLTGCSDHILPPDTGIDDPSTSELYTKAAQNLANMQAWYEELDKRNFKYVFYVYTTVKGGETPPANWKDILIDVFVQIGIAFLEAATEEIPGLGAAIAIAAGEYEKWGSEKSQGGTVDAAFGEYTKILLELYEKVDNSLSVLQDPSNNYANLKEAFKNGGSIEFNGKKYTLSDLASSNFPAKGSQQFVSLLKPAELSFKRSLWNAITVKAGEMRTWDTSWSVYTYGSDPRKIIRDLYANNDDIPAAYFRGYYSNFWGRTYLREYTFYFDGRKLDADAAQELFKDDIRGHIINPAALFDRDYVYKQFHVQKPDFGDYCDVALEQSSDYYDCSDFTFTGGIIKKI